MPLRRKSLRINRTARDNRGKQIWQENLLWGVLEIKEGNMSLPGGDEIFGNPNNTRVILWQENMPRDV